MNEKRNYSIIIEYSGGGKSSSPIAGANSSAPATETAKSGLLNKENAQAFAKGMTAYSTVKSFATQVVNYEVSLVNLRTGSKEMQDRASFINTVAQRVIGVGEMALTGAMVGGLGGALVGTVLGLSHTIINYAQQQNTLNMEKTLENQSIQMNYIRAGASGSRR